MKAGFQSGMTAAILLQPKDFVRSPELLTRRWSREESLHYTRWLATHHYENFPVVSFLLPKHLHEPFFNVYSFCRWADDLGDEIGDTAESLRLLQWWRGELEGAYSGEARHPVFVALRETIAQFELPAQPFHDLISAFEQDQVTTRYRNWDELFAYCRDSANPVGRLVLYLCGYRDAERQRLSDATCTGLQLANFWQDVSVDWQKDRVYLPLDLLERHGCNVEDIGRRRFTPEFGAAMREACQVARAFFEEGLPLADRVDRRLAIDLELFSRGGLRVLDKIEAQGFNVLERRPVIGKVERVMLLLGTLARRAFHQAA
jgi:squalene synthase HpnC